MPWVPKTRGGGYTAYFMHLNFLVRKQLQTDRPLVGVLDPRPRATRSRRRGPSRGPLRRRSRRRRMAICGVDAPHPRDRVPGTGSLAGAVEVDGAVERVGGALEAAQHCGLKCAVSHKLDSFTQSKRVGSSSPPSLYRRDDGEAEASMFHAQRLFITSHLIGVIQGHFANLSSPKLSHYFTPRVYLPLPAGYPIFPCSCCCRLARRA